MSVVKYSSPVAEIDAFCEVVFAVWILTTDLFIVIVENLG